MTRATTHANDTSSVSTHTPDNTAPVTRANRQINDATLNNLNPSTIISHDVTAFTKPSTKCALAKRIHDIVELEERELKIIDTVQDITEHLQANPVRVPDISIELCVLNVQHFEKGWHITLIDKEAKKAFKEISNDLDKLDYSKQKEFIFRLTVWEDKKNTTLKPDTKPGSILYVKRVHQLQTWKGLLQGTIRDDEFHERNDRKKTKMITS